ncbi:MAG: metallophosphoesterase family protein [Fibrobacter sp.]|nr:metallophosphoesterase family protein [Fibrobacter sp.]
MKIGIVSDTHRNIEYLEKVADWAIKKQKIAALYHLGDDYDDVAGLADRYIEIVQVPGIYDERYKNGTLQAKTFELVLGLTLMLVHSFDKDVTEKDISKSDIILSGHTHHWQLELEDGRFYMNPGHLKGPLDKNMPPTFGILNILDREVTASIYDLNFTLVESVELVRAENGLYKAS